jgi:hypothetical protein
MIFLTKYSFYSFSFLRNEDLIKLETKPASFFALMVWPLKFLEMIKSSFDGEVSNIVSVN